MRVSILLALPVMTTLLLAGPASAQQPTLTGPTTSAQQPPITQAAAPNTDHVAKMRAVAQSRMNARRVRIRLMDGTLATGRVVGITNDTVAVQPGPSDEPVLFEFAQMKSIDGPGWPRWTWGAIGVGAAAALIGIVAAAN
jgi:hypothetical protein